MRTVTAGSLLLHCLELMELAAQFGTLGLSSQVVALPSAAPAAAHKRALEVDLEIDKKAATQTGRTLAALSVEEDPVVVDFHKEAEPLD